MGFFNGKKAKEKALQDFTRQNMSPGLAKIAYSKYSNNGEIHNAAQNLSEEQVEECYQAAFLLFLKKSYSEQTHQIMALAAMGGHAFACVRMGFLQPSIEEIWRQHCDDSEYQQAKAAWIKIVGPY
jgi:hypothetical protein